VVTVAPLGPACEWDSDTERWRLRWGAASYGAGFEEAEDFWYRAYVEACRRGLGTAAVHTVVLLGDGAEWIWRQGRAFLALPGVEGVEIIDLYHAYEYLWALGNAVFGAETPEAAAWVEPLKTRLYAEGPAPVQAAVATLAQTLGIPETEPEPEEAGGEESAAVTAVRRARAYLAANAARLDYPAFVARQFPIGSGAVESAGKTVIQARTKGAGMHWSGAGAQAVVSLRTLHRSGRWDAFWQSQPQRARLRLFPHARPTRTAPPSMAAAPLPEPAPPSPAEPAGPAVDPPAPSVLRPASRPHPTRHQRPLVLPRSLSA
jgi:hypothetical protein